ncbi:CPBP family intramembrane glutamic endopeptidase [Konateibacter massiliensis]|uniref:CPBP family intramembrane glutamic endopeptidase n=1 Tax=Konateibacter massiliensis TaxID=2002841 RepID=UPI000C14D8E3|nr:CPBP family intramembrane glutamic endopeptidase [Konateibacter massiliensis]
MKQNFRSRHPYVSAILIGLLCTFLTALGMAISQIAEFGDELTYVTAIIFLCISILVGIFIMKKSSQGLSDYGLRKAEKSSSVALWWYIPLIVMEIIPIIIYGFDRKMAVAQYVIILFFTIAVGINEELYFRGLMLRFLREKGRKKAIVVSAVIFGVLHLINALNGKNILYLVLQMLFAFLVGFVLAEIVSISKSLWIVIIWHASHDFISMTTEGELDQKALILLAIQVVLLLIYAVGLWKKSGSQE